MRIFLLCTMFVGGMVGLQAQSTAFVLQGGPSLGTQRWGGSFDRQPLLRYHVALGIESVNNEDQRSSLMAQVGYHIRGSAVRFQLQDLRGNFVGVIKDGFEFRNASLLLAAKQRKAFGANESAAIYYYGGVRGEYTLSTNLDKLSRNDPYAAAYYPQSAFVRKIMAGVSVGGGVEWALGELVGAQLGFAVQPDFTNQYSQPPITNVIIPNYPTPITIPERSIRNVTVEVSLGLRLLRKVVYTD